VHTNECQSRFFADLDWETPLIPDDVINVTRLDNHELSNVDRDTREALITRGEMNTPLLECSEEGRRLHTLFMACKIEWRKRRKLSG
jgi:hypothetical protein